jgi:hypothetical protein
MESNLEQLIADAIHQYVSQALGRELPIWAALYLLTTAIVAAVAAYLGSYLRKRAEQSVINANFGTALAQLREQTTATETIKAELTSQIEALKSVNERQRSFAVHQRERIIRHIDALFDSAAEVLSIADVCRRRTWTEGGDHAETQQRILSQISAMRLHIVALRDFNAIEDSVCREVVSMLEAIRDRRACQERSFLRREIPGSRSLRRHEVRRARREASRQGDRARRSDRQHTP